MGEIEGLDSLALLLIGPPQDLSQVRTIVTLVGLDDATSLFVSAYLVELLSSVLPTWTDRDEWLANATDSLVAGVDEVETTHGTAVIKLVMSNREWAIVDLVIESESDT